VTFYTSRSTRLIGALVLLDTEPIVPISELPAFRLDVPASTRSAVYRGLSQEIELIPTTGLSPQRLAEASGDALLLWQRAPDVTVPLPARNLCGRLLRYITMSAMTAVLLIKTNSV
jgi:hypothetical protein